jgi:hypothetical protein
MGSVLEVEIEMARRGRKKRFHTEGTEKRNSRRRRKAAPTWKKESGEKRS